MASSPKTNKAGGSRKGNPSGSRTQLRAKGRLNKRKTPAGEVRAKHGDLLNLRVAALEVFNDYDWAKQGKEITLTNKEKAVANILLSFTLNSEKKPRLVSKSRKRKSSPVPEAAPGTPLFRRAESVAATAIEEEHELSISLSEDGHSPEFPPGFEKPVYGPHEMQLQPTETYAPPVQHGLQTHTPPLLSINYETPEVLPQNTPLRVTCIDKLFKSSTDMFSLPKENNSGSYCPGTSSDLPPGFEKAAYVPQIKLVTKNYAPPMRGLNEGNPEVQPQSSTFKVNGVNTCFNDAPVGLRSKLDSVSLKKENASGSYCSETSSDFPPGFEKPAYVPQVNLGPKKNDPPMLFLNEGNPEVQPQRSPFHVTGSNTSFNDASVGLSSKLNSVALQKENAFGSYYSDRSSDFPLGFGKTSDVPQVQKVEKIYAPPVQDLNDETPEVRPQRSPLHVTGINKCFNDASVGLSSKLDFVSLQKENDSGSYRSGTSSDFPPGFEKPAYVPQVKLGPKKNSPPMLFLNDGTPEVQPQVSSFHVTGSNTCFNDLRMSSKLDSVSLGKWNASGSSCSDLPSDFPPGFVKPAYVPQIQKVRKNYAPPMLVLNDGTPEIQPQSSSFHVTGSNRCVNNAPGGFGSKLDSVSLQIVNVTGSYCSDRSSDYALGFEKPSDVPQVKQVTKIYAPPVQGLNVGNSEVRSQSSPFHVTGINTSFDNAAVLNSKLLDPISFFNNLSAGVNNLNPYGDFLLKFANPSTDVPLELQLSQTNAPPVLQKDLICVPQVQEDLNAVPMSFKDVEVYVPPMQQSLYGPQVLQCNQMHLPDQVLYDTHMLQETQAYPDIINPQEPLPSVPHLMSNAQGLNSMPMMCGAPDHEQQNVENRRLPTEVDPTLPAVAALNESMRESPSASSNGLRLLMGGFLKLR